MSCKDWKEVRLSDIGEIVTGKTPRTNIAANYGSYIPFLTPSDDMCVKCVRSTRRMLSKLGLSEVKNCLLPENSICVSCIGSDLGKVVKTVRETVTNQQINSIIPNNRFDPDFIYYSMLLLGKQLNYISKTSTAVPIVNKSSFSSYSINVPDEIENQRAISAILSSLDEKIELNKQINDNLEQQAQAIFNEMYQSTIGSNNRQQLMLSDIVEVRDGTHDSPKRTEEGNYLITSKHLKSDGSIDFETAYKISDVDFEEINRRSGVDNNDILYSMIGTIGNVLLVNQRNINFAIKNMALFKTSQNQSLSYFLYLYLKNDVNRNYIESRIAGSTQQYVTLQTLRSLPVIIPSKERMAMFVDSVRPIFNIMHMNRDQIKTLTEFRDTLLPKLLSGEIIVQ